ncbi:DUF5837 family protein [Nostoc sp. CHAB 5784]|uniref:DUF5837 family cyanobactin class RiPP n=1 Tax=Nostoc mirabile TaxID=2907820 RepID=UPI001E496AF3|nr:DUF5837 family cyanobactin class RiPP [Nostoc mirabile]MCC5669248.1 DUF5837 family protein [Nostoc mirabile CHAB5784]
MDKQNLMPQPAQPVNRIATGQLPTQLAELSEFTLSQFADAPTRGAVLPSNSGSEDDQLMGMCSYNGEDVE